MIDFQVLFLAAFLLAAFFAAAAVSAGFGLIAHVAAIRQRGFFHWLFPIIVGAMVLSVVLSRRSLSNVDMLFGGAQDLGAGVFSVWLGRLSSALGLAICVERLARFVFVRRSREGVTWAIFLAFVGFVLGNVLINGAAGTQPGFSHRSAYPVLAILVAVIIARDDSERSILWARNALLGLLIASACVAPLMPDMVFQKGYGGISLPGLKARYWGLATHANSLGPLAVVFLMLIWYLPFRSKIVNMVAWPLGFASLLLAQSKTAYVLALACLGVMLIYRVLPWLRKAWQSSRGRSGVAAMLLLAMLVVIAVGTMLMFADWTRPIEHFLSTRAGGDVLTLTGRNVIWAATLREWQLNLWFGYGPALWDLDYRYRAGLLYAFHAHNQFIHSLGSGGIIGLFTAVFYSLVLLVYSLRAATATRGLSVALLLFIGLRSITEVPLLLNGFGGPDFFTHLLLVLVCAGFTTPRIARNFGQPLRGLVRTSGPMSTSAFVR